MSLRRSKFVEVVQNLYEMMLRLERDSFLVVWDGIDDSSDDVGGDLSVGVGEGLNGGMRTRHQRLEIREDAKGVWGR